MVASRARTRAKAAAPRSAPRASQPPVGETTREHLITTAERLFAEEGVAVSVRQIGEAAGQANKSAVAYHFGTKTDLVLAIARRHAADIERRRSAMLKTVGPSDPLVRWLGCVVEPITEHLASLAPPSSYARFLAACVGNPALRDAVYQDMLTSDSMRAALTGLVARLPVLPPEVFDARGWMMQHVIVHTCADLERTLQGRRSEREWKQTCAVMLDALQGLWCAPVTPGT